ncbi:hypothetical protein F4861DRAFT_81098 [Xylaria intraflava]|nr:hypothetical protein F4861DRAFT_81098 [Xylaria intraflava]
MPAIASMRWHGIRMMVNRAVATGLGSTAVCICTYYIHIKIVITCLAWPRAMPHLPLSPEFPNRVVFFFFFFFFFPSLQVATRTRMRSRQLISVGRELTVVCHVMSCSSR